MLNTKLSLKTLKNHWHYGKWIYAAVALSLYFIGSMAFTMTAYRAPAERKVEFQLVGTVINIEGADQVAKTLLPEAQVFDPTLEEINVYNIMYSGDASSDYAGAQKYMVMLSVNEGAVYIVNRELMTQLVDQGVATPLDPYIQSGQLNVDGIDLADVTLPEPAYSEDEQPSGASYIYALPCADLERFMQSDIGYDVSDKYMVLMSYTKNPDTAVHVMQGYREAMK